MLWDVSQIVFFGVAPESHVRSKARSSRTVVADSSWAGWREDEHCNYNLISPYFS
jgi:hypothetical protein